MDPYTSQIMIDRHLTELRAQGDQARAARIARRGRSGSGLRSGLWMLVRRWRAPRITTTAAAQKHRPTASRPA